MTVSLPAEALSRSIPEQLDAACGAHADRPAVVTANGTLTLGEVARLARRVAGGLADLGVGHGDRVALLAPNHGRFPSAYLGIQMAGAAVVPVNVLLAPDEMAYILADAGCSALIHHPAFRDQVARIGGHLPALGHRVLLDGEPDGDEVSWERLTAGGPLEPVTLDAATDLAAIIYTSGTTGRPKGAMLSHRNLVSNTFSARDAMGLTGDDRVLVVLPMFHAFAATAGMLTPLLHGASLVPLARFEPEAVMDTIRDQGVTVFLGVPSMYAVLLRAPERFTRHLAGLRTCVSGGAAMPVEVMRRFEERFGCPVYEGDGPTECGPVTCINPLGGERRPGSVGLPVTGVEMCILDDAGAALPDGETGEIAVRGPNVMKGYWRQPQATREAFSGDWFLTGDLGHRDADGYFHIVDRKKDMVIVNGMNVYPRMVEEVIYRHPAVREAAVVGEPHRLHGEIPVAYVALDAGVAATAADIRALCQAHLGRHEVPRRVEFVDALPKNATGKILKRELRRHGELERGVDTRAP